MDSYRLQLQTTLSMVLEQGEDLKPIPTEMRGGGKDIELDRLSNILSSFNEKYKGEFGDMDKIYKTIESVQASVAENKAVVDAVKHTPDNASITIEKSIEIRFIVLISGC